MVQQCGASTPWARALGCTFVETTWRALRRSWAASLASRAGQGRDDLFFKPSSRPSRAPRLGAPTRRAAASVATPRPEPSPPVNGRAHLAQPPRRTASSARAQPSAVPVSARPPEPSRTLRRRAERTLQPRDADDSTTVPLSVASPRKAASTSHLAAKSQLEPQKISWR